MHVSPGASQPAPREWGASAPARRARHLRWATAKAAAALAATTALAATGCGSSASHPGLTSDQRAGLRQKVAEARRALTGHDAAAAYAALDAMGARVRALTRAGSLSPAEAQALLNQVGQARARVPLDVPAPAPPVAPSAAAASPPFAAPPARYPGHSNRDDEGPPGHGNGERHGKGKGKGNSDGGD
jgi:hypothetical protein